MPDQPTSIPAQAASDGAPKAAVRVPLWTRQFTLVVALNAMLFIGFQSFPAALPPYLKGLGASDATLGWLTAIAAIPTLITRPLAGMLLDTLGRRRVLLAGLSVVLAASAAMGFLPFVAGILVLRFIHGLGWGVASTSCSTIASDIIPRERLGEGIGFFSLAASLGLALAPAIVLSLPPEGMFIMGTGFLGGAVLLALRLERPAVAPPAPGERPRPYERTAVAPAAVMFCANMSYGCVLTFLAVHAAELGVEGIGLYFTAYSVVLMATRPAIGRLVDRVGVRAILAPSLICITAGMLVIALGGSMPAFLAAAVLYGFGQGSVHTASKTLAVARAPARRLGAANATFATGFDGGLGFGAILAGILADHLAGGYAGVFLCMAACPLVGLGILLKGSFRREDA